MEHKGYKVQISFRESWQQENKRVPMKWLAVLMLGDEPVESVAGRSIPKTLRKLESKVRRMIADECRQYKPLFDVATKLRIKNRKGLVV